MKRGTVTQMNSDLTVCKKYFAYTGQIVYKNRRKNSRKPFKISQVEDFLKFAEEKNTIPRKIFNYRSAQELFNEQISLILAD